MDDNEPLTQLRLRLWARGRMRAFLGLFVVGTALASGWLLPPLIFYHRFGAFIPHGVAGATNVIDISMSSPPPTGVPKTYSRQVREFFGCYPQSRMSATWWKQVSKALDDVLAEYGARVQDDKLTDASGKAIYIIRKWRHSDESDGGYREWEERRRKLSSGGPCIILVVDVEED